jgi:hypothetical protein
MKRNTPLKLYSIFQTRVSHLDSFDSAVVCATSAVKARRTHPDGKGKDYTNWRNNDTWCTDPDHVTAEFLGDAGRDVRVGVICASFNAG